MCDNYGNRDDGRQTFESTLKIARSSNYDLVQACVELTDNSLEHGANEITIKFQLDPQTNRLSSLIHYDNGPGIEDYRAIYVHGYNRQRENTECGCYGIGMKNAMVNIGNRLEVTSLNSQTKTRCTFDIHRMTREDNFIPKIDPLVIQSGENTHTEIEIIDIRDGVKNLDLNEFIKKYSHRYNQVLHSGVDNIYIYLNGEEKDVISKRSLNNLLKEEYGFRVFRHNREGSLEFVYNGKLIDVPDKVSGNNKTLPLIDSDELGNYCHMGT